MNAFLIKWKQLSNDRKISRYDMALYCLSKAILKDDSLSRARYFLSKSFTPVTKQIKLDNGAHPYGSLYEALDGISASLKTPCYRAERWLPHKDLLEALTDDDLLKITGLIQSLKGKGYGQVYLEQEEVQCLSA